jgi:type I restriction enzyme M protein
MVALPGQLFYSTQIPVCLWFLAKNKTARHSGESRNPVLLRDRRKQTLFIDARKLGTLIDRVHRELTDTDIAKIVGTYHAWRRLAIPSPAQRGKVPKADGGALATAMDGGSTGNAGAIAGQVRVYEDVAGFCKSATTEEIAAHGYVLTPGRYVGAEEVEDDGEPFEEKMLRMTDELQTQFSESSDLEQRIKANLQGLGYGS